MAYIDLPNNGNDNKRVPIAFNSILSVNASVLSARRQAVNCALSGEDTRFLARKYKCI